MRLSVDEAFRRYGDRVFSAAFSVCGNREDADDTVQDTFLKYYTREQDYIDETHLKAWLLQVAINRAKDIAGALVDAGTIDFSAANESAYGSICDSITVAGREYRQPPKAMRRFDGLREVSE